MILPTDDGYVRHRHGLMALGARQGRVQIACRRRGCAPGVRQGRVRIACRLRLPVAGPEQEQVG